MFQRFQQRFFQLLPVAAGHREPDAPLVENAVPGTPLGGSGVFRSVPGDDVEPARRCEALHGPAVDVFGLVRLQPGMGSQLLQHRQHRFVKNPVTLHTVEQSDRVSGRNHRRVGQIDIVKDVAAAGRPADNRIMRLLLLRIHLRTAD